MDQNGLVSSTTTSNKKQSLPNHRHVFIKRTLQLLLPFTFASFLISMTSTFSLCFNHYFHHCFSTLVFPIVAHAFERKYMFLIGNGILAFLVKTLNLDINSEASSSTTTSSPSVLDVDENHDSSQIINPSDEGKERELAGADSFEYFSTTSSNAQDGDDEQEHPTQVEEENDEGREDIAMVRESESVMMNDDDDDDEDVEEEEAMEEGSGGVGGLIGGEGEKEDGLVNMNTEELNQKIEEFIRKMKEELRIQETQKLIAAV